MQTVIAPGALESSLAMSTNISLDLLNIFYTDASWAAEILARYASIKIKGFSVTRLILAIDCDGGAVPIAPEYPFINVAWRIDPK